MITYKCKNCGGQMDFGGAGGFVCQYCGSKAFFTDADFKGNKKFRSMLLQYYKAEAENKDFDYSADRLWSCSGTARYIMSDGESLQIEYMAEYVHSGYICYLAKESVIYVFDDEADASLFLEGTRRLSFPSADNKLYRSFPELKMRIGLNTGKCVLVFLRRPNVYPARMFAPWQSVHLAWVISRMENFCCTLEYSGIEHGDITPDSVWINPFTHEGVLFGDWRKVSAMIGNRDLVELRKTAIELARNTMEPLELYRFLNSDPASDAYDDFSAWDKVINDGFGGHKFVKMDI